MSKIANKQMICEVLMDAAKTDRDIVALCSDSPLHLLPHEVRSSDGPDHNRGRSGHGFHIPVYER